MSCCISLLVASNKIASWCHATSIFIKNDTNFHCLSYPQRVLLCYKVACTVVNLQCLIFCLDYQYGTNDYRDPVNCIAFYFRFTSLSHTPTKDLSPWIALGSFVLWGACFVILVTCATFRILFLRSPQCWYSRVKAVRVAPPRPWLWLACA